MENNIGLTNVLKKHTLCYSLSVNNNNFSRTLNAFVQFLIAIVLFKNFLWR